MEEKQEITVRTQRRFSVPGDIVNQATETLSDEQRIAIRWLHAYGAENDLPLSELAALIRYDDSTLSRVFAGKYQGKLDGIVEGIVQFRKLQEQRSTVKRLDFIPTSLSQKVWRACEAALTYQRMIAIYGNSQIGKTAAAIAYQEAHNHGETKYVRMPEGGYKSFLLEKLALQLQISPDLKMRELERRVLRAFDDRMLLIVDEVHQVFSAGRSGGIRSLEFLRQLYDERKCGVVLIGTNIFRDEMQTGRWKKLLEQLSNRCIAEVQLPNIASKRDLDTIAKAYGLAPATGDALRIETDIITERGLGKWMLCLQAASRLASRKKEQLDWSHVIAAFHSIKHLASL